MTLVELIAVMALISVVMVIAASSLVALSRTGKATQDRSEATATARQAMERVIRDLRAANPIDPYTPVSDYSTRVGFSVFCANSGVGTCPPVASTSTTAPIPNLRQVVYQVVNNRLEVTINGVTSPLLTPEVTTRPLAESRFAIVNDPATEPVFTYFDAEGAVIDPATAIPTDFQNCTKTVQVHLKVLGQTGDADSAISLVTRVALRNFNEVSGCISTP